LVERLRQERGKVHRRSARLLRLTGDVACIDPTSASDYRRLLGELAATECLPDNVVHAWSLCIVRIRRRFMPTLAVL